MIQFKKQFSRVSTGATNVSNRQNGILSDVKNSMLSNTNSGGEHQAQRVFDRLKSIEKINEERIQLVGLKSSAASRKSEPFTDAFDVDLQVSSDYGGLHDLDQVEQLRSIGSVSMNQGAQNNIQISPLIPSSQH